jgi:hypothetical protein
VQQLLKGAVLINAGNGQLTQLSLGFVVNEGDQLVG